MNFDYCISNPAFNIAEANNIAGTGGNTTLYKTATRNDFNNRLKNNGSLINITLKGIITDLVSGYFKDYQVDFIHLMDNIDVWPYNTCFFSVSKKPRTSPPKILGGLAAKIFSPNPTDCFPFTYYSGSNSGMNKLFGPTKKNKVVRQLPGRGRDSVSYDHTDAEISVGWKFAFYVMESKKSYTVTNEPVYGGTICYVPTETEDEAKKLKLFVENNEVYAEYVRRMKLKGHAFGLRNIRKFDLSQIVTGEEIPKEWNITDADMLPPTKLNNDISQDRDRVKALGEVFTPTSLVEYVLDTVEKFDPMAFAQDKTFIDSMCGDGQFLVGIKNKGVPVDNIYGIDLTQSNIDVALKRINGLTENVLCANSFSEIHTNQTNVLKFPKPKKKKRAISL
jgi:2-polyprenyl-3-methyl-5-hydroxy-6-metoxy-1,4-benzoquinol methylase